ncbi:ATP-binding protein [Gordonia westfalica]|uniref:AAA+ ATPase domain-containing protein n=1 Tax=Gordonia westfalica TaxID=158898 RepID=A0A1H2LIK5_9ACTN|nr:ATP-binding protein [Gordonia westfalica]SDU80850.1 hypothetical protein SAMN04488548_136436 [Gordonia westfalica]
MSITGDGFELTHVSVRAKAPLDEMVHFELNEQLSVLYGLNGAGKTRLLHCIADALSGRLSSGVRADLHFWVDVSSNPSSGFTKKLSEQLSRATRELRGQMYTSSRFDEYEILYEESRAPDHDWTILQKLDALIELHSVERGLPSSDRLALQHIAENGRFTLQSREDGRRVLWLAGHPFENAHLRRSLEDSCIKLSQFIEDIHNHEDEPRFLSDALVEDVNVFEYYMAPSYRYSSGNSESLHRGSPSAFPVVRLGSSCTISPVSIIDGLSDEFDADSLTLKSIVGQPQRGTEKSRPTAYAATKDGGFAVAPKLAEGIAAIEHKCNSYLSEVLINPPVLRFNVPNPDQLLLGSQPHWEFSIGTSDSNWAGICELSSAQLRWTNLAIALALAERETRPTLFLCDEPERGLHRLAEQRVADGLTNLIDRAQISIIAATHSPLVIGSPGAQRILTYRNAAGATALRPWRLAISDSIEAEVAGIDLGLAMGDLLQLMNVAVVVEGLHDQYVLENLLRTQLVEASAGIYAMRGAARAKSLAEARFMFQATNGSILVVLDGLTNRILQPVWEDIKATYKSGDNTATLASVGQLAALRVDEADMLAELAKSAVESKTLDRIEVYGLGKPDIICYLPASGILTQHDVSWDAIQKQWEANAGGKPPRNIKKFLNSEHLLPQGGALLNERVRETAVDAAKTGSPIHPDLIALGEHISSLARRSAARQQ